MIFQKVKNYCREKICPLALLRKCVTSEMALWLGGKMTNLNPLWQHWKKSKEPPESQQVPGSKKAEVGRWKN